MPTNPDCTEDDHAKTELFPALDLAFTLTDLVARLDELIVEALVISLSMIMLKESGDSTTQ